MVAKEAEMKRSVAWIAALAMAAAGSAQQPAVDGAAKLKMICKRDTETGSLVAKKRQCRTKQDWDRIAEAARSNLQYEMDRNMSRPGGQ